MPTADSLSPTSTLRSPVRSLLLAGLLAAGLVATATTPGCSARSTFGSDARPHESVVKLDGIELRSDYPITKDNPLVGQLRDLRIRLSHQLRLDPGKRPVVVYLFADEGRYASYMAEHFPGLPNRRAFFVGSPGELAVYAFWGASVDADLRHECTHGLLHSSLGEVPLWLDEGLAEYFETDPRELRRINTDHTKHLQVAIANGWRPDLQRLERLETVDQMQRADYQEAWAWVHFLMHESGTGRDVLLGYLHDLPNHSDPPSLAATVREQWPAAESRLTAYVSTLTAVR